MKVYLAQLNPKVGDLEGNLAQIRDVLRAKTGADLVVFPELFLTGYPPKDLLLRRDFLTKIQESFVELIAISEEYPQVVTVSDRKSVV